MPLNTLATRLLGVLGTHEAGKRSIDTRCIPSGRSREGRCAWCLALHSPRGSHINPRYHQTVCLNAIHPPSLPYPLSKTRSTSRQQFTTQHVLLIIIVRAAVTGFRSSRRCRTSAGGGTVAVRSLYRQFQQPELDKRQLSRRLPGVGSRSLVSDV